MVIECWYNGILSVKRGDTVKIIKVFEGSNPLRVTTLQNETEGTLQSTNEENIVTSTPVIELTPPIIGRITATTVIGGNRTTTFTIEQGIFTPNQVFVKAGDVGKGQASLSNILKNELNGYLKLMDPYISPYTIKLLADVPKGLNILIITTNIEKPAQTKTDATKLSNKVTMRKSSEFHDRYILTKGRGWSVGHSLKNFGSKGSSILKLESSSDIEGFFDEVWNSAKLV